MENWFYLVQSIRMLSEEKVLFSSDLFKRRPKLNVYFMIDENLECRSRRDFFCFLISCSSAASLNYELELRSGNKTLLIEHEIDVFAIERCASRGMMMGIDGWERGNEKYWYSIKSLLSAAMVESMTRRKTLFSTDIMDIIQPNSWNDKGFMLWGSHGILIMRSEHPWPWTS